MLANAEGNSVRQRIAELSFSRRVRDFPVASVQALLQVRSVGETVEQQWRDALAAAHRDFLAPLRSRKGVQQLQYATLQRLEKTYTPEHGRPPSLAHIRTPSVFAALVAQAFHPFFEKPDDTTRDLCVKLLAFASQGRKGVDLTSHTARVYQNVASIARLCNDPHTLSVELAPRLPTLCKQAAEFPLSSMGLLFWIRTSLSDEIFLNFPFFRQALKVMTKVLVTVMESQPLQRREALDVLLFAFMATGRLDGLVNNDARKSLLEAMIRGMAYGMAVPVLQFVTKWAAKMDRSLVRHFISHLLLTSVAPFSLSLMKELLQLLALQHAHAAMVGAQHAARLRLVSFVRYCDKYASRLPASTGVVLQRVKRWAVPEGAAPGVLAYTA